MAEHPYKKLKADYDHLLDRMWDLFKYGLEKEGQLKEAVVNEWKNFERIADSSDPEQIKRIAIFMRDFLADRLDGKNEPEPAVSPDDLIFVGYTNGYQILYGAESEGAFYSTTDNDCWIPLYMMKRHEHRLQTTSGMDVTIGMVKSAQSVE